MSAIEFISQPRRQHGTRTRILSRESPHRVGQTLASSLWKSSSSPWEKTTGEKRTGKKTDNPHNLTCEVSEHRLPMKWRQGYECLFSIICWAMDQCQVRRGIQIESQCLHHHRPRAWERLQVWIPRPTKLKEFHIDKNALFPYKKLPCMCLCQRGWHTVPALEHQTSKNVNNLAVICGKLGKGEVCAQFFLYIYKLLFHSKYDS